MTSQGRGWDGPLIFGINADLLQNQAFRRSSLLIPEEELEEKLH